MNYKIALKIHFCVLLFFIYECTEHFFIPSITLESNNKSPEQIGFERKMAYTDSVKLNSNIPILITRIDRSQPNSAGGVDLKIGMVVFSEKTIKYIRFTVDAYNKVQDKVRCEILRSSQRIALLTGPYKKGFSTERPFTWENMFYNNTIDCFKLVHVEIEYMDGSIETFSEPDIKKLLVPYRLMFYYRWKNLGAYGSDYYGESRTKGLCNY